MKKDFLTVHDLAKGEILQLIETALRFKKLGRKVERTLVGYTLGLIFEKASTRTRVSFEAAMFRLGGQTLFLSKGETQMARDESVSDTARVISRYLDGLAMRTYSQEMVEEMARWAEIPVINALTDRYHPCQVLSDLMTVKEKKGRIEGLKIAWVGDGNNVAHSWIDAAHILGFDLTLACPPGYHPHPDVLAHAGKQVRVVDDPREAVEGADVVNTDVWASMGQESQRERRIADFKGYQVNESLVRLGKPDVIVMHCLPAHRGEEITTGVLEGQHSVVFDQAENKFHLHMALLEKMMLRRSD
jgi:ornithine carbamoyltransferase